MSNQIRPPFAAWGAKTKLEQGPAGTSNRRDTDADRVERSAGPGSIKDAIGTLSGNVRVVAEGKAGKQSPKSDAKPGSTRTP